MEETIWYVLIEDELINEEDSSYVSYGICLYSFCDGCYKKIDEIIKTLPNEIIIRMEWRYGYIRFSKWVWKRIS